METIRSLNSAEQRLEDRALAPLQHTNRGFIVLVAVLLAIMAWGGFAYYQQLTNGLYVTGMRDRIFWGLYIALFVFFVGASMGGTFVSAMLRLIGAEWRAPVTRAAEYMTVSALICAAFIITVNMSNPFRMQNVLLFGRWESQLIWDTAGLLTYLAGSALYLYLALIPDLAMCRDRLTSITRFQRVYFRLLAVGYRGTPDQVRVLASSLTVMTFIIVPIAVMMHTVTSWIFSMTLREPWDSSMFGIYFVMGAVYSGVGLIIILMAIMRKVYHLEEYITEELFIRLGVLLAGFGGIMIFFQVSEFFTSAYKLAGDSAFNLNQMVVGGLAPLSWAYLWGGLVLPMTIMVIPVTRKLKFIVFASVLANIGMLFERIFIVVGGLRVPLNPYEAANYFPTWVEWSMMAAVFALFVLLIALMTKAAPGISVSELREFGLNTNSDEPGDEVTTSSPAGDSLV